MSKYIKEDVEKMLREHIKNQAKLTEVELKKEGYEKKLEYAGTVNEETAIREVYEETGVKVRLLGERFPREDDYIRPLGIQKNRGKQGDIHIDITYVGVPISVNEVSEDDEVDKFGWFSREELDDLDIFEDIKITMDYILKNYIK